MSFDITLDYRFDSSGFFNDPDRRAALEAAANAFETVISDDFNALPVGLTFTITNPSDGFTQETVTITEEVDDLIIFVAGRNLNVLGFAGPDGYSANGDIYSSRISENFRNTGPVTDFEPWAGTVVFDQNTAWNFDLAGPQEGQNDFISVAIHEIAHVLGFGTSPAFTANVSGDNFVGPNATAANGGTPVPLEPDAAHVLEGYLGGTIALDPTLTVGNRKLLTEIDKAILADIGYQVDGYTAQGSQPPVFTNGPETIFGTDLADDINGLGGADQIQGGAGNDTLRGGGDNDLLFGQAGIDTFVLAPGDGNSQVVDFDLANEKIRLLDSNFASPEAALAAVQKPFSNVSRIALNDGSSFDIFHDSQTGTPLTAANFEISNTPPPNTEPTGNVAIIGTATQGQTLLASTAGIDDADGLGAFSYVWLRADQPISGATSDTYDLVADDVGEPISVRVSFIDGGGTTETLTSGATDPVIAAQSNSPTPGPDLIVDDASSSNIDALAGDDTITGGQGDDTIEGGEGTDVAVFSGDQSSYTLTLSPGGTVITDRRPSGDGTDSLFDIEFLDFANEVAVFGGQPMNLGQFGGQTGLSAEDFETFIELYIAYFNRAPDAIGLSFWGTAFATGTTLPEIATFFIDQDETRATYPDTLSNADFATAVYNNVLGRVPDIGGFNFWVGVLDGGSVGRDQFIIAVLQGAKAPPAEGATQEFIDQQLADRQYLADKTDIGAYYAVHKGLSDVAEASATMALFDGSQNSIDAAVAKVNEVYADALDPDNGEFLMPLVGILVDPFTV